MTSWRILLSCPLQQLLKTWEVSGCCGIMMGNISWAFCCDFSFESLHSSVWLWPQKARWAEGKAGWVCVLAPSPQQHWPLRDRSWGCGIDKLPPALSHCGSIEPLRVMLPSLHWELGWEGTWKHNQLGPTEEQKVGTVAVGIMSNA